LLCAGDSRGQAAALVLLAGLLYFHRTENDFADVSNVAIRVDHLSKRYRLGERLENHPTLRDAMVSAAQAPWRMVRRGDSSARQKEELWAVRDVCFDVRRGEVLGIIGRNGAGKSTVLKLLSRVTRPTAGRAEIHGRVGCLLEVGTGFHPELTGRENIYLNGAVLGMTRADIRRKFDEIVAFAEIDRFLDTPVKRYSSGMHMRLAFSIAAHLEPEILIVDEVLAVGDAVFQKKCLGKIGSVAHEGRTVVFVSHSMPAVLSLCQRSLWLDGGQVVDQGAPAQVVQRYLASVLANGTVPLDERRDRMGDESVRLVSIRIESAEPGDAIRSASRLKLVIHYRSDAPVRQPQFVISILDQLDIGLFVLHNHMGGGLPDVLPSVGSVTCITEPIKLTPGRCVVHVEVLKGNVRADYVPYAACFDVEPDDTAGSSTLPREWAMFLLGNTWRVNDT
jgi:lipopolysaccharide transport system ATP-binding protein